MSAHRIAILLLTAVPAACHAAGSQQRPPIVQPGAPGEASRVISAETARDLSRVQYTAADVRFMQGMIGHHQQAVEMVDLLRAHTSSDEMRKLEERIAISQTDEIKMMLRWLEVRGQEVPGPHAMHMHGAKLMPGMLEPEEMERL